MAAAPCGLVAAGDADAAFSLGQMYRAGVGTPADPAAARRWYQQALDQGYQLAKAGLAALGR